MTYNKTIFNIEGLHQNLASKTPKRLPGGVSPSSRANSFQPNSNNLFADSLQENIQALNNKEKKKLNTQQVMAEKNAGRHFMTEQMVSDADGQRKNAHSLSTFAKVMQSSPDPLKTLDSLFANPELASQMGIDDLQSAGLKQAPFLNAFHEKLKKAGSERSERGEMAVRVGQHRRTLNKNSTIRSALNDMLKSTQRFNPDSDQFLEELRNSRGGIGSLAAKFESGRDGIAAIGYDRAGGTSYGKYQLASRVGSMDAFIDFLDDVAPDIASKLKAAGSANTGGRTGKMPAVWKQIASSEPERFENLQEQFIQASHYLPALGAISKSTGIEPENMPLAMHEVIFSTAVQHGPSGANRIFARAFNQAADKFENKEGVNIATSNELGEALIKSVYKIRSGQFASSSAAVRGSVQNRLRSEMNLALNMLKSNEA
ncbi:hypothetical protein [Desulfovibrio litoralis]|uniref:Type VI secretion system spike protein VgrG3-like C-terminal domain-containing protein n=1 Tax=Desulfovibrio litoralis DSM 11393 TaxID=1121455 RepID=A0A1M7T294_9BACT|nr:hypothetical protein [Desulfovibrio litoralis]SHN64875.1 hypothetical protein SAMN02745728_01468 [Desulfovibrio litoralis DSM 11393]